MKWIAVIVVALVAGAVGTFAIWTFGWRDDSDDEVLARAAARQVVERNLTFSGAQVDHWTVAHVEGDLWKMTASLPSRTVCLAIYIDDFRPRPSGKEVIDSFYGLSRMTCK